MSYARFGQDGSHVYVYRNPHGAYVCCGCPRLDDAITVPTASDMIAHLELDRSSGYVVPDDAIDRLRTEAGREAQPTPPPWLVKDFSALFLAAYDVSASLVEPELAPPPLRNLRAQLDRLRPAFDACEWERGLIPPPADPLARIREALAICAELEPQLWDPFHCAIRAIRSALADGSAAAAPSDVPPPPPPTVPLVPRINPSVVSIIHERVPADGFSDAWRGALMGWHVRHVHPEQIAHAARWHAPIDEPARSAWLTGYRLAVDAQGGAEPDGPTGGPDRADGWTRQDRKGGPSS